MGCKDRTLGDTAGGRIYPPGFEKWLDRYFEEWRAQMDLARVGELETCWWESRNRALAEENLELKWFRDVCAEEMGVDAPGCDGAHPLRDWLRDYKALNDGKTMAPTLALLSELKRRGGNLGALAEAGLLAERKGSDYNTAIKRDDYFPMGVQSYAQMLYVKALRLVSFAMQPRPPSNESLRDTALDMVNYASFFADWLSRREEKNG